MISRKEELRPLILLTTKRHCPTEANDEMREITLPTDFIFIDCFCLLYLNLFPLPFYLIRFVTLLY